MTYDKDKLQRAYIARSAKIYGESLDVKRAREALDEHLIAQIDAAVAYVNTLTLPDYFGKLKRNTPLMGGGDGLNLTDPVAWCGSKQGFACGVLRGDDFHGGASRERWYWKLPANSGAGETRWADSPVDALIDMIAHLEDASRAAAESDTRSMHTPAPLSAEPREVTQAELDANDGWPDGSPEYLAQLGRDVAPDPRITPRNVLSGTTLKILKDNGFEVVAVDREAVWQSFHRAWRAAVGTRLYSKKVWTEASVQLEAECFQEKA